MNNADVPSMILLGTVAGIPMKAKVSDNSAVATLPQTDPKSATHLVIVAENEALTWQEAAAAGMGHGDLVSLAMKKKAELVSTFLPGMEPSEVEIRFEVNSPGAASRPTLHTHVIMAHKANFGKAGAIRRCIDDIRKPELLKV